MQRDLLDMENPKIISIWSTKDTDLEFEVEVDVDIEINEMETPSFYLSHLLSDHLQEDARVYRFLDTYAYEHLGNDLISYIDKYISRNPHKKHSERNSMYPSPCFFYHAAVTLPQPLIYAAEIICLLKGMKPVVMIQYKSPSEHQWKFPLVRDLIASITLKNEHQGDKFDVGVSTLSIVKMKH